MFGFVDGSGDVVGTCALNSDSARHILVFTWLQVALHVGNRVRFHFLNECRSAAGCRHLAAGHLQSQDLIAVDAAPKYDVADHSGAIRGHLPQHRMLFD